MTQRRQRQLITVRSFNRGVGTLSVALARFRVGQTTSPEVGTKPAIPQRSASETHGARPSRSIARNRRERVNFLFSTAIADAPRERALWQCRMGFTRPGIRTFRLA